LEIPRADEIARELTTIFLGYLAKTSKDVQHFYFDLAQRDEARKAQVAVKMVNNRINLVTV
jgi:hypothetical protein